MLLIFVDVNPASFTGLLVLIGLLGAAAGYFFFQFLSQRSKIKVDAVAELSGVVSALKEKIELLGSDIGKLRDEHERCQRKLNEVAAFNLRLQAREAHYQTRINRLERALNLEITDFNDFAASPESSVP